MVKRPKSPEIVEDVRYFTVYQPYPLYANWPIEEEQIRCATWVAECIGAKNILAIYHKPKARGMILLEISKAFTDHGRLLGEHRWNEMLKDPDHEEAQSYSQVFHSFYSTGREAQKDGWKFLPVKNIWFQGWQPGEGDIRQPYPATHWCPVPAEDKTNKPLCRPLPREHKTPPPRNQLPVVGSEKWVENHVMGPPSSAWSGAASGGPGKSKPPSLSVTTATAAAYQGPSQTSHYPASASIQMPSAISPQSSGSSWLASASGNNSSVPPSATKTKGTWGKPVPFKQFNAPDTKSGKSSWGPVPPAAPPGVKSPLTEEAPMGPVNAWTKPLNIPPSEKPAQGAKGAPTPSPNSNSPWSQTSALAPASPWGTPASLTSPSSASANDAPQIANTPKNGNANAKEPNNNAWGSKANKKRGGTQIQTQAQPQSEPRSPARDKPPHQHQEQPKRKWDEEPEDAYFPPPSNGAGSGGGPIREVGFEKDKEDPEDLENEFLHPWEANNAAVWRAPPASSGTKSERNGGNANGKPAQQQGGQKSARGQSQGDNNGGNAKWGEKSKAKAAPGGGGQARQNGTRDQKQKGKDKERKNQESASWSYQRTASNRWGDEPIKTDLMDWKAETAPANSWGDAELKMEWISTEPSASNSWGDAPLNQEDEKEDWGAEDVDVDMEKGDKGKGKETTPAGLMQDRVGGGANVSGSNNRGFDSSAGGGSRNAASSSNNDWGMGMMEPSASEALLDWSGAPIPQGDWGTLPADAEFEDWQPDQNLWVEEVQDEKPPELICPTHNIACKKGICRDMAKLVKEQERKQRMEERRGGGRGGGRGRGGRGRGGGYAGSSNGAQLDEDGFAKPHKKTRRGKKWYEKSFIGKMRAFGDDDKEAQNGAGEAEGETAAEASASQVGEEGDDRDEW